jgi:hypothetical protein
MYSWSTVERLVCVCAWDHHTSAWQLTWALPSLWPPRLQDCCVFESEAYGTVLVLDGERGGG